MTRRSAPMPPSATATASHAAYAPMASGIAGTRSTARVVVVTMPGSSCHCIPSTAAFTAAASATSASSAATMPLFGSWRASSNPNSPTSGPLDRAFSHSVSGAVGRFQVGTEGTEYATAIYPTNTKPAAAVAASHATRKGRRRSSRNDRIQYTPPSARNATAATTSFDRGERPMPVITYSAFAGVPRWVADAMRPEMASTSGTTR